MAFLLDDTTLKVENYIIVIEFCKLEFVKEDYSNIPQYFYLHHKK